MHFYLSTVGCVSINNVVVYKTVECLTLPSWHSDIRSRLCLSTHLPFYPVAIFYLYLNPVGTFYPPVYPMATFYLPFNTVPIFYLSFYPVAISHLSFYPVAISYLYLNPVGTIYPPVYPMVTFYLPFYHVVICYLSFYPTARRLFQVNEHDSLNIIWDTNTDPEQHWWTHLKNWRQG